MESLICHLYTATTHDGGKKHRSNAQSLKTEETNLISRVTDASLPRAPCGQVKEHVFFVTNMSSHCQNCDHHSFFEAQSSPFQAHLGKCIAFDTPQPHDRRAIVDSVHEIEQDIASCRERIAHFTAALESLEELRRSHIGLFPPIHTLPVEVLLNIFTLAVPKPYDYSSMTGGPWGLGHVCRLWRQITSAPSSLWSFARCRPPKTRGFFRQGSTSLLNTIFERSSPLSFDCELAGSGTVTMIDILKSHSLRWYNITIHGRAEDILKLAGVGQLPLLDTAVLQVEDPDGMTQRTFARILDIFQHAPELVSLDLDGRVYEHITQLASAFPWHQLQHLGLLLSCTFLLDCQLLVHCPRLKSYATSSRQEPEPSDIVLHSKLESLELYHIGLLRYLQCAALRELKIHVDIDRYDDDAGSQDYIFALETFMAHAPVLATVHVVSYSSARISSLLSTFTSASIETFKLEVSRCSTDVKLLSASASPLLLPRMVNFECTSLELTVDFIRLFLDVIESRWHVERSEVAKLRSVRLCFEDVKNVQKAKLSSMTESLRLLKAEGLDVGVYQYSAYNKLVLRQLL